MIETSPIVFYIYSHLATRNDMCLILLPGNLLMHPLLILQEQSLTTTCFTSTSPMIQRLADRTRNEDSGWLFHESATKCHQMPQSFGHFIPSDRIWDDVNLSKTKRSLEPPACLLELVPQACEIGG